MRSSTPARDSKNGLSLAISPAKSRLHDPRTLPLLTCRIQLQPSCRNRSAFVCPEKICNSNRTQAGVDLKEPHPIERGWSRRDRLEAREGVVGRLTREGGSPRSHKRGGHVSVLLRRAATWNPRRCRMASVDVASGELHQAGVQAVARRLRGIGDSSDHPCGAVEHAAHLRLLYESPVRSRPRGCHSRGGRAAHDGNDRYARRSCVEPERSRSMLGHPLACVVGLARLGIGEAVADALVQRFALGIVKVVPFDDPELNSSLPSGNSVGSSTTIAAVFHMRPDRAHTSTIAGQWGSFSCEVAPKPTPPSRARRGRSRKR